MTTSEAMDQQATVIDVYQVHGKRRTARDSVDGAHEETN